MKARALAVLLLVAMMSVGALPASLSGECRGVDLATVSDWVEDPDPWTDDMDDLSHVYVPVGGLVGVRITDGEATLVQGQNEGWIASSIITCPPGNRFDLVVLDTYVPGDSLIEVSILDASSEATEVGYANATIGQLKDMVATSVRVRSVDPATYPGIRIQVTLKASGTDRPALRGWSLHYSAIDEWRDDFINDVKLDTARGVSLVGGQVQLDLTSMKMGKKSTGHEAYPTVVLPRYETGGTDQVDVLYPNFDRTGYESVTAVSALGTKASVFADIDGDGYLDLVMANGYTDYTYRYSQIYWGGETGKWGPTDSADVHALYATKVAASDVDGDGDLDLAFSCYEASNDVNSQVFYNRGDGSFGDTADVTLVNEYTDVAGGDLNGDGYDDLVFGNSGIVQVYYGDVDGISEEYDLTLQTNGYVYDLVVEDMDGDGYYDILVGSKYDSNKVPVYMGSIDGVDDTADHELPIGDNGCAYDVGAGDLNGDGHPEIIISIQENHDQKLYVYPGSENGWQTSSRHIIDTTYYGYGLDVCDVDLDGYGDLLVAQRESFQVYNGGETLPTNPSVTKDGFWCPTDIAVAAGGATGTRRYMGKVVTEEIALPEGKRWDTLVLDADRPANTSVSISILDQTGKAVTGYKDLTTLDVDLGGLGNTRMVSVEIWLETDVNTTTPRLDRLRLKWQDTDIWREQFWGAAKTHRLLGTSVDGGRLVTLAGETSTPDLLFTSLMSDEGFDTSAALFTDRSALDYATREPIYLNARATSSSAVGDANGDGIIDIVLAVRRDGDSTYSARSLLFLGTPVGWRAQPSHSFPTVGASDVLMSDLDGDGHQDIVFAQELSSGDAYDVNSTLFWGSATGYSAEPDVQFTTRGATGVVAADLDGDGRLDLAFSCYKAASTSTDSMVFLQKDEGFHGAEPDHRLPTLGATGVAAGDIDGNGQVDLAFSNGFHAGSAEVSSYVYWNQGTSGFGATPASIPTKGARDVQLVDVDGDGDLDAIFANYQDNAMCVQVDSTVHLFDATTGFSTTPDAQLPTVGAVAVTAADIDGEGWMDLVFACQYNGSGYTVPSLVYLGSATGYPSVPDLRLPTVGASHVVAADILRADSGGYISQAITPPDVAETGSFHTLLYECGLTGPARGSIHVVDSTTWETLASRDLSPGDHEWSLVGAFPFKDHPSVRVMVTASSLEGASGAWVDDLWLNWTPRVHLPPAVLGVSLDVTSLKRTETTSMVIDVTDEHTPASELALEVEHRLEGDELWTRHILGAPTFGDGVFSVVVRPMVTCPLGEYSFRVRVTDGDGDPSPWFEPDLRLEILNNPPTAPTEVRITPARAMTTSTLRAEIVRGSSDVESDHLSYSFSWMCDGQPVEDLAEGTVPPDLTSRGQNWTVVVRAFDGDEEGPATRAWRVIDNAAPIVQNPLPELHLDEDTPDDEWWDLAAAFMDPDGDPITWEVDPLPVNLQVTIDPVTGLVTVVPTEDWNGEENVTFVCSDGELRTSTRAVCKVLAVNDLPRFIHVDGKPIATTPVAFHIMQGDSLVVRVGVLDVEGHELVFSVNTSLVDLNGETGEIRFVPDNNAVGILRFALKVHDVVSPNANVCLDFVIDVENVNDPMDKPKIVRPQVGDSYKANRTFSLIGSCSDPDTEYGQVLNYTWSSSVSGLLGYGASLTVSLPETGTHVIILTVTDGEFEATSSVTVDIEPGSGPVDPDPDPGSGNDVDGSNAGGGIPVMAIGVALAVLVAASAAGALVMTRSRSEEAEADAEELSEEDRREVLTALATVAREAADTMENGDDGDDHPPSDSETSVEEEVNGVKVAKASVPDTTLSMEARVTEAAPKEIMTLFEEIEPPQAPAATAAEVTPDPAPASLAAPSAEELRIDSMKRKYQNAIGRLPYGIPSPELRDRDWVELAAALATGEKRALPDGGEITLIDDRWYHSDVEDASTFLKEHGARPREKVKPSTQSHSNTELLEKLEERFIMGEISEESYRELRDKLNKT